MPNAIQWAVWPSGSQSRAFMKVTNPIPACNMIREPSHPVTRSRTAPAACYRWHIISLTAPHPPASWTARGEVRYMLRCSASQGSVGLQGGPIPPRESYGCSLGFFPYFPLPRCSEMNRSHRHGSVLRMSLWSHVTSIYAALLLLCCMPTVRTREISVYGDGGPNC